MLVTVTPSMAAPLAAEMTLPLTEKLSWAMPWLPSATKATANPKARPSPLRAETFAWVQTHDLSILPLLGFCLFLSGFIQCFPSINAVIIQYLNIAITLRVDWLTIANTLPNMRPTLGFRVYVFRRGKASKKAWQSPERNFCFIGSLVINGLRNKIFIKPTAIR